MSISRVLLAASIAIAASAAAHAEDTGKGNAGVSQAELKAKTDYCKTCHGLSGQAFVAPIRCRDLPDSSPNTSQTSFRRSSTADETTR